MRMKRVVGVLLLGALNSGCSLGGIAARNLCNEANLFQDTCTEKIQLGRLANQTWEIVRSQSPPCHYSEDYACGFKDGFMDFVDAGGTGEPPPLPPKRYQRLRFQTPQGWKAAEDWYAGFRHGAAVARDSGCRLLVALPGPMPYPSAFGAHPAFAPDGTAPPPPPPATTPGGAPPDAPPAAPPADSTPVLPAPRPLPVGPPRLEGKVPAALPGCQAGEVISKWAPGTHCEGESVLVMPFQPTGSGRFAANRLPAAAPAAPAGQPRPPAVPAGQPVGSFPPPAGPQPLSLGPLPEEPPVGEVRPVSWTPCLTDSPPPDFRP